MPDGSKALDKVDGLLEQSQTLCEHAAHQVLRDGDCAQEVSQAKELLLQARTCAEREMPSLERIAAADEERRARSEERQRTERSRHPPPPADSEKIELLSREPSSDTLEVDEIEVDDEDEDSDAELDMSAIKLPPNLANYSMRSTRLTACWSREALLSEIIDLYTRFERKSCLVFDSFFLLGKELETKSLTRLSDYDTRGNVNGNFIWK
jgi:hypothetical protein